MEDVIYEPPSLNNQIYLDSSRRFEINDFCHYSPLREGTIGAIEIPNSHGFYGATNISGGL